jgi:hypothetical protein
VKELLGPPRAIPSGDAFRAHLRTFLERRRRLLVALLVAGIVLGGWRARQGAERGSHAASLATVLTEDGLEVDPDSVVWLGDESSSLTPRGALLLGRLEGEPNDVYYAEARTMDGGGVADVGWLTNLSRSSSADERDLTRSGPFVLYASHVDGVCDAVTILDAAGEPAAVTRGWPRRAQIQNAITNLQETGRTEGFGRRRYAFVEPAADVRVATSGGRFEIRSGDSRVVLDPRSDRPLEGAEWVELRHQEKGMPGTITWVVDTVRNTSFVGPAPIEWLEHRVFRVKDALERGYHAVFGASEEEQEQAASEDLGVTAEERRRRVELAATDPEIGWPPAPLEPVYASALEGEGEWLAVVDDPFVRTYPNAPPAFYTTYLRPDLERSFARAYITVWDSRQVQLHIMSGTREPESATGATGRGMAPREPEVLESLVGGFNGGFQALHGEFGMMSEGRVYLPPKPWAATVAVYEDGRVALGSWMAPPEDAQGFDERWATAQIPEGMIELRQNLTSVVEGDRFNPWGRWWWGAAPLNADEQVNIDRSGLCLTSEGFLAYFWGKSLSPEALGEAMLRTRCVRGMHLDMNSRHTGFEFYDVFRPGERPPLPSGSRGEGRFEGPLPHAQGWTLRSRLMVRSMTPMRFPRYASRDPRDFFYLTLRAMLPGPDLADLPEGEGRFDTQGLPHAGYPNAFARLHVGEDAERGTWLVRIDPRRAVAAPLATESETRPLAYLAEASGSGGEEGALALYAARDRIGYRFAVGAPPEDSVVLLRGPSVADATDATAAIGVDPDGFLLYAERADGDPRSLAQRLAQAGVTEAIALADGARLAFQLDDGAFAGPDAYEREVDVERALAWFADQSPAADVLFPDTEPRPYSVWARIQDTRVRYRREGDPTFSRSAGGVRDEGDESDAGAGR